MKIDWNPSPEMLQKMKRLHELKEQGKTYEQISAIMGRHRTYLVALHNWYKKEIEASHT